MHRQSIASRSQFGQSSAQTATAQALRNKKKEYEAISALEQSCAGLIATLEDMAADLNTTAEATIGAISSLNNTSLNAAERCFRCLVAIGKAMEHWTDMFQILSISRTLHDPDEPSSRSRTLNELARSRGLECTRPAISSKPSGSLVTRRFTGKARKMITPLMVTHHQSLFWNTELNMDLFRGIKQDGSPLTQLCLARADISAGWELRPLGPSFTASSGVWRW